MRAYRQKQEAAIPILSRECCVWRNAATHRMAGPLRCVLYSHGHNLSSLFISLLGQIRKRLVTQWALIAALSPVLRFLQRAYQLFEIAACSDLD
jgi:hypothetical protein